MAKVEENYYTLMTLQEHVIFKKRTKHTLINIGSGVEKSIKDFAKFIMRKMKVDLKINYDLSKPNGTPRKN